MRNRSRGVVSTVVSMICGWLRSGGLRGVVSPVPKGEGPGAPMVWGWFALGCLLMLPAVAQAQSGAPVVLDRVIAVVNRDAILASDLDEEMRLSVLDPSQPEGGELSRAHLLDQLIGRTLVEQQIRAEESTAIEPPDSEVEARIREVRTELPICVRRHCDGDAEWHAFLAEHGLSEERVEAYMRYRLEILDLIELRFRSGISISAEQTAEYYKTKLVPQYGRGETPPPLEAVAQRIDEILLEQQVSAMFDQWLESLRRQGDVEIIDAELKAEAERTR